MHDHINQMKLQWKTVILHTPSLPNHLFFLTSFFFFFTLHPGCGLGMTQIPLITKAIFEKWCTCANTLTWKQRPGLWLFLWASDMWTILVKVGHYTRILRWTWKGRCGCLIWVPLDVLPWYLAKNNGLNHYQSMLRGNCCKELISIT